MLLDEERMAAGQGEFRSVLKGNKEMLCSTHRTLTKEEKLFFRNFSSPPSMFLLSLFLPLQLYVIVHRNLQMYPNHSKEQAHWHPQSLSLLRGTPWWLAPGKSRWRRDHLQLEV